jgi:hypothetical protein
MAFSDFIVYANESGDHSLVSINPQNVIHRKGVRPMFSAAGANSGSLSEIIESQLPPRRLGAILSIRF